MNNDMRRRWRVSYYLLGSNDPEQQMSMDVMALGPIEAEDEVKAQYSFAADPYIVNVDLRDTRGLR